MNRDSIDKKYTWDLNVIYSSISDFNKEFDEVKDMINDFSKYENIMLNNGKSFYETLEKYYCISRKLEKLYAYTHLLFDTDTSVNDNQFIRGRVTNLYSDFNKVSYFVGVTSDLAKSKRAGDIVKVLNTHMNGRGGGKPDFAQGGCKSLDGIEEAIKAIKSSL